MSQLETRIVTRGCKGAVMIPTSSSSGCCKVPVQAPRYEPLEIQDPKKYFMRGATDATAAVVKPEPLTCGDNDMEAMQVDAEGMYTCPHIHSITKPTLAATPIPAEKVLHEQGMVKSMT